jgi:hypothetical protein
MSEELRSLDAEFDEKFLTIKKGIEKLEKEKEKMQVCCVGFQLILVSLS